MLVTDVFNRFYTISGTIAKTHCAGILVPTCVGTTGADGLLTPRPPPLRSHCTISHQVSIGYLLTFPLDSTATTLL